ncbi:MFS transporter [Acetobacteraceae bacterium H6797]|nr:MFS transporter [Acetobacteraceae bacterium H6797]
MSASHHTPPSATPGLIPTLATVAALLLGYAMLQMGNTLQGTLLAVRGGEEGFSASTIGLVGSGFFAGLMVGSLRVGRVIRAVGQTRAFAALAALASVVPLLHLMVMDPVAWVLSRALTGFCFAGLFIAVESWLNGASSSSVRGRILGIYGMTGLIAGVGGQLMLPVADTSGFVLFCVVSMIISLALVPVTLSRAQAPQMAMEESSLNIRRLYRQSPFGVVAAFLCGVCTGAFFSLGPLFAKDVGLGASGVAIFMALGSLGGFAMTWPLGWLSDLLDRRRLVVSVTLVATIVIMGMMAFTPTHAPHWLFMVLVFIFGGLVVPTYSVVLAHVNDHVAPEEFVSASGGLLLLQGAGAALGPLLGGFLMEGMGPRGLGWLIIAAQFGIAIWGLFRMRQRAAPPVKEEFQIMPALPVGTELVAVAQEAAIERHETEAQAEAEAEAIDAWQSEGGAIAVLERPKAGN